MSESNGNGNKRDASQISSDTKNSTNTDTNTDTDANNFVELPFYGEHKRAVSAVAFAPTLPNDLSSSDYASDTKTYALCASASADATVRLWDIQKQHITSFYNKNQNPSNSNSNDNIMSPVVSLSGHSRGINDVCWSPTTKEILCTASDDKTLRLWDVTRSSSSSSNPGHSASILDSAPSPTFTNPNPIPTETPSHSHTTQGETLVEFKGHSNFCFSVKFSPQGNLLVSGSFDETVKIWDVRNGECVATLPAHSDPVTCVDFNRDGTCIVSSSHDGLIRIWDVATGECLKTIYAEGNPPVTFVKYSPNGKYILSGMLDGKLRLWNVMGKFASSSSQDGSSGNGSVGGVSTGSFGLKSDRFGVSTTQGRGGQCTKSYSGGHVNSKYCIFSAFNVLANPNQKQQSIVTGSEDGNVYIYDLQSRAVKQVLVNAHSDACLAVAAHDKKELLATGGMSSDKCVRFWVPSSSSS